MVMPVLLRPPQHAFLRRALAHHGEHELERPAGRMDLLAASLVLRATHGIAVAGIVSRVESHLLTLAHASNAGALQCGGVDEHVLLAITRLDKAEAFLVIVELNRARILENSFSLTCACGIWRTKLRVHCHGSPISERKPETWRLQEKRSSCLAKY
jgi:hypothetical protein